MNLKKPIILSLIGLVFITVISVIIFIIWKPDFIVTINHEKQKQINWGKLISLSCVLGILVAIVLYISTMKSPPPVTEKLPGQVSMGFVKISDCY